MSFIKLEFLFYLLIEILLKTLKIAYQTLGNFNFIEKNIKLTFFFFILFTIKKNTIKTAIKKSRFKTHLVTFEISSFNV